MPGYWVISKGRVFQKNANSTGSPKEIPGKYRAALSEKFKHKLQFWSLDEVKSTKTGKTFLAYRGLIYHCILFSHPHFTFPVQSMKCSDICLLLPFWQFSGLK